MAHSIIILNSFENFRHVSVSWLVMAGTHTLRYETISTRKFFSFKYVTEKCCHVVSCWDHIALMMNEWMFECEAMMEWYWQVKIEVLRRKSVPVLLWLSQIWQLGMSLNFHGERQVTAGHRCSLIMFCHCHLHWTLKRKIRNAHVKSF